jgi:hypothetical protein
LTFNSPLVVVFWDPTYARKMTPCGAVSLPGTGSVSFSVDISPQGHVFATTSLIAPGRAIMELPFVMSISALQAG